MSVWPLISARIGAATGEPFSSETARSVGGGCINSAYLLEDHSTQYFVKTNRTSSLDMFEAEAEGLVELARARAVRVPQPVCTGTAEDIAYLVLEYLPLASGTKDSAASFGRQLAELHRTSATHFGWFRDNTIGSTLQINTQNDSWVEFWREQRLGYQLSLAARNGYGGRLQRKGERLLADLDVFFAGQYPRPSLLHGDLWSGNYSVDYEGTPVIYDPATYYGDREAELAMTELFGGFPESFYQAYREAWPLAPGYSVRKTLYNLYHVLNHLNLFGGGYGAQAEQMLDALRSEVV